MPAGALGGVWAVALICEQATFPVGRQVQSEWNYLESLMFSLKMRLVSTYPRYRQKCLEKYFNDIFV